jgi:MoxR-like ATPase
MTPPIPRYPAERDVDIDEQGTWPAAVHRFDERGAAALRAAEACGRPLLVRGAPGVGKSQTARAAAAFGNRPFLSAVIDGRTEPHDLMWRFDAVRRLADAQVLRPGDALRPESHYVEPQALWWAYDWNSAGAQPAASGEPCAPPSGWDPAADRAVLLIDEIDKADPDLPNALLEVLANKGFSVPYGHRQVKCSDDTRPLVVITTNEERELPNAFLRRCLVLTLELPDDETRLRDYLVAMGERHQAFQLRRLGADRWPGPCHVLPEAATRLWSMREAARRVGGYAPGTAEFLDLAGALATLHPDDAAAQREALDRLAEFSFHKDKPVQT